MKSILIAVTAASLAVTMSACKPSGKAAAGNKPQNVPLASASPSPKGTPAPTGTANTTLDPCALVTAAEASALTGASYGPGKLEVDSSAARRCIYGAQTKNVFTVIVAQATSVAQAQAVKDQMRAQAEQALSGQPVNLNKVSGVGDDAESISASFAQYGISLSGLYVLKGTVGFALVDLVVGAPAPTVAALTTQAQTVIGRLP
jgi:hypothetical protein